MVTLRRARSGLTLFSIVCVFRLCVFRLWVFGLSVLGLGGCDGGPRTGLGPGDSPPVLSLTDLSGEPASLKDYQGKVVLLNFWASWCAPCLDEMPELERLYTALSAQGFVVVAVGVDDSPEELARIRDRFSLSFPILVDTAGSAKSLYHLAGFPESFFMDRSGRLVMVLDPSDSNPVVRVIGPRSWGSDQVKTQVRALLTTSDGDR